MKKIAAPAILRSRAYVRVSHVGKRQETLVSDAAQLAECKRYSDYMGFEFDEGASRECADLDVSGFRKPWRQRPGLMAHYAAAQRGEFQILVFFKISRLARNVKEALDLIDAFAALGVSFHFVAERIDSSSAQGRFLRNVLLASAEMASEDAGEFLRSTFAKRARDGKVHGKPPLWIRRVSDQEFELIPEQVSAIRRMMDLRRSGYGYTVIARALNEEGFRTVNGCYWTAGNCYKYLSEPYLQRMEGASFFGVGSEDELRIDGAFPAIITPEEAREFRALQSLYSAEWGRKTVSGLDWMVNRKRKNGRYSASTIHLLSSLIHCPSCGARMIGSQHVFRKGEPSSAMYSCPRRTSQEEMHIKGLNSIDAANVEDAVLRVVRAALAMPPAPIIDDVAAPALKADLALLQRKIDRIVAMHLDGAIDADDFKRTYAELVEEKSAQLAKQSVANIPEFRARASELLQGSDPTREEMRQLVLLMVERVEAPIHLPGVHVREGLRTLRRIAKVTLRFPTAAGDREFYAPIYQRDYIGAKVYASASLALEQLSDTLTVKDHHSRG